MDETTKRLLEDYATSLKAAGSDLKKQSEAHNALIKGIKQTVNSLKEFAKATDQLKKSRDKWEAGAFASSENNKRHADRLTATFDDLTKQIEDNLEAAKEEKDEGKKYDQQKAAWAKSEERRQIAGNILWEKTNATIKDFTKLAGASFVSTVGGALKNIQSNAGAIETGTSVMTAGIQLAGEAGSAAGKGITAAGTAMSVSASPKIKALGAAAQLAGAGLDIFSSKAAQVAKFAVEFLGKELGNLRDGFRGLSSSGALFSNGMTGMLDAAHGAGLTVQQFSQVVKDNSKDLAGSGLGMTGAVERMGKVTTQINNSGVGTSLQKLGFTFEEQAGLVAEVMGQMNRYGNGRVVSDAKVAELTERYAKDLRLISGITGEDAKAKMAEARASANNLAFQNKLAEMAPEQAKAIQDSMATMSKQQQKDVMEKVVFGAVVNKTGAIMMSANQGYANQTDELASKIADGSLTVKDAADVQAKYSDEILKDRQNLQGVGMAALAGFGNVGELAAASLDQFQHAIKYTPEAVAKMNEALAGAANTSDPKTKGYLEAEKAFQNSMIGLQTLAMNNMDAYVNKLAEVNGLIASTIASANKQQSTLDKIGDNFWTMLGTFATIATAIPGLVGFFKKTPATGSNPGDTRPSSGPAVPGAPGGSGPKGGGPAGGNRKQRRAAARQNKGRSGAAGAIAGVLGGGAPDGSAANPYHVVMASGGPGISDLLDGGKNKGTPTKTPSKLGTIAKVGGRALGAAGSVVAVGMMASELSDISKKLEKGEITKEEASKQKGGAIGEAGGGVAGGLAGAAMGAAVGSVVPVVGTIIGGLIGGALGAWGGGAAGRAGGEAVGTSVGKGGATPTTQAATVAQLSEAQKLSSTQYAETLKAMDLTQPDLLINKSVAEQLKLAKAGNTMFTEQNKLLEKMAKSLEDQSDYLKNIRGNTA
jgi:hypothetical protein